MIAAMASAFAVGQIAGPLVLRSTRGSDGEFSRPLIVGGLVLGASAWALARPAASDSGGIR